MHHSYNIIDQLKNHKALPRRIKQLFDPSRVVIDVHSGWCNNEYLRAQIVRLKVLTIVLANLIACRNCLARTEIWT